MYKLLCEMAKEPQFIWFLLLIYCVNDKTSNKQFWNKYSNKITLVHKSDFGALSIF